MEGMGSRSKIARIVKGTIPAISARKRTRYGLVRLLAKPPIKSPAPQVAAVTAAIGAAGVLGDFAYRLLRAATGNTIGLYRNSHLQYRDGFGVGPHPNQGTFRVNDLSFRYEIARESAAPASP